MFWLKKKEGAESKPWLSKLLGAGDEVSSKRVVGVVGAVTLFATMAVNSATHQEIAPSDNLVDAVLYVTLGTLGMTTVDKFKE